MVMESNLQSAYALAYEKAMELLNIEKLDSVARITESLLSKTQKAICVRYLNTDYFVNPTDRTVIQAAQAAKTAEPAAEATELSVTEQVLILHYLTTPKRFLPLQGPLISFKEIPQAQVYYPAFEKRVIGPMVKWFSADLEGFRIAGGRLSAKAECYGHISHTVNVFPLVPVTYVLWQGDEEVPPSGTVLFDASVTNYLSAEDIVVAASFGLYAHRRRPA